MPLPFIDSPPLPVIVPVNVPPWVATVPPEVLIVPELSVVTVAPAEPVFTVAPASVPIWADPAVTRNTHTIRVEASTVRLTMTIENVPSEENPRTGKITPLSILACLRGLTSTLKVGS